MLQVPLDGPGLAERAAYDVDDLLSGQRFRWGALNYVRLDPADGQVAHLLRVAPATV
jgi:starch synthase (maltosyl-transferring)